MANGAVCVSDGSIYLHETLKDTEEILFYSLKEISKLPDTIRSLLNHPEDAKAIAKRGYTHSMSYNTWAHRADVIIDHLRHI